MHNSINNLILIEKEIQEINPICQLIVVTKTFGIEKIEPIIKTGHKHFGENKVQEALEKWTEIKNKNKDIKLHMVGKLQTNKVKLVLPLFDFIHSLDNLKLAKKISEEQKKYKNKPKIFIQINIGNELQKSGIDKNKFAEFYNECINLGLNIVGTMCLPPADKKPDIYFEEMEKITNILNLNDLSMGMSDDYLTAAEYYSTYLRIGSKIFGARN